MLVGLVTLTAIVAAAAYQGRAGSVTAAEYSRAEKFMGGGLAGLETHSGVVANWLADDRLWYEVTTERGRRDYR